MLERLRCAAAAGLLVLSIPVATAAATTEVADPPDTNRSPAYELDEVIVTASRYGTDVHLSHTNIPETRIDRDLTPRDVPMLLQGLPGVYSYSDAGNGIGYTYLKIRGFDQRRIGVLINGIPLNDPEDHQVYWVNLADLGANMQDIQVQRGVTNGVGGVTAIGGTVNLVTERLDPVAGGDLALEVGSFGTSRRTLSYQTGELGDSGLRSRLRISQIESDGYRERAGTEQWSVFWSGLWRSGRHEVSADVFTGHQVSQHAWDPAPESILAENRRHNPETYWNAIDDFRQPHYQLHWEWDLGDRLLLRNSVYHVHGEGFYENFKAGEDPFDFSLDAFFPDLYQSGGEVDLVRTKWVRKDQTGWVPSLMWDHGSGRLVVGGDYYTFHSNHWGDVLYASAGTGEQALTPGDVPGGVKYHDYTGDKDAYSLYVNERWQLLPGLTVMADLQYQHRQYDFQHDELGNFTGTDRHAYSVEYDFFNPKGGLFWQTPWRPAGGDLGLYGHVGITHREPTDSDYWGAWNGADDVGLEPGFREREEVVEDGEVQYVRWSDPIIDPERVVNWEGGLAFRTGTFSVTLNGYYMDFEDEIVETGYSEDDNGALRYNADETVHKGLELGLRWRFARDHHLRLAASRSWNEYERFVFVEYPGADPLDVSGNPIPLFPEAIVSATWTSAFGPFSGDVEVLHVGKQYLDNTGDEDRTIDASTVVNLAVFADLGRLVHPGLDGARAHLRVLNLLDEKYETWGYYDAWTYGENMYIPGAERNLLAGVTYEF
ncbi:TonB-dependent receptor [bacterium]|nr:TonB-dependent receptor [bacterium]